MDGEIEEKHIPQIEEGYDSDIEKQEEEILCTCNEYTIDQNDLRKIGRSIIRQICPPGWVYEETIPVDTDEYEFGLVYNIRRRNETTFKYKLSLYSKFVDIDNVNIVQSNRIEIILVRNFPVPPVELIDDIIPCSHIEDDVEDFIRRVRQMSYIR
jgi:hypothetical protein